MSDRRGVMLCGDEICGDECGLVRVSECVMSVVSGGKLSLYGYIYIYIYMWWFGVCGVFDTARVCVSCGS